MSLDLFIAAILSLSPPAPDYGAARAAAIKTCEAINPADYQSGLAFNPDGYRSYYVRSECLQRAAVQFRDASLCRIVRERRALFSSSWGYSPENCRKLVAQAIDADRTELQELRRQYLAGQMVLRDVTIQRNGNGRDYDVLPSFTGTNGHGYTIAIEILTARGAMPIHSDGYFVDPRSALRLFIRQQDIKARFPAFEPGQSYRVRAVVTYSLPAAGASRYLSDAFLEQVFPVRERRQSIEREIRF